MIYLSHCARIATSLWVACSMLFGAGFAQNRPIPQKRIDASYIWKPSREAAQALNEAFSNGNGTKQTLLRIMRNDRASDESLSFAASFSTEAAYLSANERYSTDGFSVGDVTYPFRKTQTRTYVILNGRPRIIDVADQKFLSRINISFSKDLKSLSGSSTRAECVWSEPQGYNVQPGMYENAEITEVEVKYPIKNLENEKVIGFAYVVFQFGDNWTLVNTELEMITDAGGRPTQAHENRE